MTCAGGMDGLRFVGDPIDVVTGAFIEDTKDFQIADSTPIVWRRLYSSRDIGIDRGLGVGHTHSFDHRLRVDLDGIRYTALSGTSIDFPLFPMASPRVAARGYVLVRRDRTLVLETPTRVSLVFEIGAAADARLAEVRTVDGPVRLGHDVNGRLASLSNDQDSVVTLTWDAVHIVAVDARRKRDLQPTRVATYRYDADRLVTFEDGYRAVMEYAHDASGRVIARADRRGYKFGFRYDADGRCVHSAAEDGVLEVQLAYFPLERRTVVTKSDGGNWEYFYDDVGTVITIIDPEGATRAFVPRPSDGQIGSETDGAGNEYTYEYDDDGRLLAKRDALGRQVRTDWSHPVPANPAQYELGHLGVLPDELPTRAAVVHQLSSVAAATLVFASAPGAGRLNEIRDIQGLLVREERDGRSRRYAYDAGGNIRWEIDLDGARRDYDVASFFQLLGERDALGQTTRLEYDKENEITAAVDPGGTRTVFLRNKRSELAGVARAGAWKERYQRDGAGRLVRKDGPSGTLYTIARGPQGEVLERNLASGGFEKYEHDRRLRVVRGETTAGVSTFAYDGSGNRTVDELDGLGVRRRFRADELVELRVLGRFVIRYRRSRDRARSGLVITDPTGREHQVRPLGGGIFVREYDGGRSETVQYHPNGNCLQRVVEGGGAAPWVRSYAHTAEGYLVERQDSLRGTTRFHHDAAHRVVLEQPPRSTPLVYEHDAAGNLVRNGATQATYLAGNLIATANGKSFAHDDHQNVHSETSTNRVRRYIRDERNQLVGVHSFRSADEAGSPWVNEAVWSAQYDALNRRVAKTHGDATTRFVWDTDRLAAEICPDGQLRVYVYADPFALTPILFVDYAGVDAAPESGTVYLVFPDHLGCPERVERRDGTIVWSARISAYGQATVEVGADFRQPLRWPGHYFDAELELQYNRFRNYSPDLGRYLEPDPLGRGGGLENVYAYTWNPTRFVDVDGLECPIEKARREEEERRKLRETEGTPDEELTTAQRKARATEAADEVKRQKRVVKLSKPPTQAQLEALEAARLQRYITRKTAEDGQPPKDLSVWERNRKNNSRGEDREKAALEAAKLTKNTKSYGNEGNETIPDATNDKAFFDVKSTKDDRTPTGKPRTIRDTDQLAAQRAAAANEKPPKDHVVIINNRAAENVIPDDNLGSTSKVAHYDDDKKEWREWKPNVDGNGQPTGGGKWLDPSTTPPSNIQPLLKP